MKATYATLFAILAGVACHHDDDDDATSLAGSVGTGASGGGAIVTQAHERFWTTFYAGEYAELDAVIADLKAAFEADHSNDTTALLLGLSHMWALGENDRNPDLGPPELLGYYAGAEEYFNAALELDPADLRPYGWLGAIQITVGEATGNADLVTEGEWRIEQSKQHSEIFGTFVEALRYTDLPVSDPGYAHGLDLMFHILDLCAEDSIDRSNPDFTPYMGQWTDQGEKRVCWNIPEAPHSFEGIQATMGGLVLKQGDVAAAGVFFHNVRLSPDYETWPFKARFEERIARDLDAELPLLQDDDPDNDPESFEGPNGCGSCHAKSIPE